MEVVGYGVATCAEVTLSTREEPITFLVGRLTSGSPLVAEIFQLYSYCA